MGMNEIFEEGKADLSDLLNSKERLHVSYVIHQATIEINEQFSEATAASAIRYTSITVYLQRNS